MYSTYPYLNYDEIDFFYNQLFKNGHKKRKSKFSFEVSLTAGAKYSQTIEDEQATLSTLEKLNHILDALTESKKIIISRPKKMGEYEDIQFVHEKIIATKLFFPKPAISESYGLNHLAVWVADPNPEDLSQEKWEFHGTFLYLIEVLYDRGYGRSMLSGCSALQFLTNIAKDKDSFEIDPKESMGRGSHKHPIKKLEDIGAVVIGQREIKTVYRMRYFTNEQCFKYRGKNYRCNDLLGYPLYIDAQF